MFVIMFQARNDQHREIHAVCGQSDLMQRVTNQT
jgi:hypothetical protein